MKWFKRSTPTEADYAKQAAQRVVALGQAFHALGFEYLKWIDYNDWEFIDFSQQRILLTHGPVRLQMTQHTGEDWRPFSTVDAYVVLEQDQRFEHQRYKAGDRIVIRREMPRDQQLPEDELWACSFFADQIKQALASFTALTTAKKLQYQQQELEQQAQVLVPQAEKQGTREWLTHRLLERL